ncbi:hypothetical protein [Sphingosinicella rhizophila]|uniref:Adenylate cyclase n=1 Tax=Sphingosinicella rhizophila TaxID=3050082 RepID=A0ABU3Q1W0_9SPHN|nr:hypothetical protein [Sphingosinicella sp. GR2756]MDT9597359.1 hypothetical protein [Sphingosinicella sp. GR2756]
MATKFGDFGPAAAVPMSVFKSDQSFFTRYTMALAFFIVFGFAQFSLRGMVDIRQASLLTHLHGAVMVAWLAVATAQNLLVGRDQLVIHRKLGWIGAALVVAIALLGVAVGFSAVSGHRVPPFFTDPYFLALTIVEPIAFAAIVAWAIALRRRTQWHRRLMLGALILILEPALGRTLPMPFMIGWGEWVILAIQLVALAVLARHDRKVLGSVHPATIGLMAVVSAIHLIIFALSIFPPFEAFAAGVAG